VKTFLEKHSFSEKHLPFKKILGHISLPLNVNQLSKEIRWLVRVGMFSQNECLVKNTLAVLLVSCVKMQGWGEQSANISFLCYFIKFNLFLAFIVRFATSKFIGEYDKALGK